MYLCLQDGKIIIKNSMKIAIHYNDEGFAPRWIAYCEKKGYEYKLVNAYDSDIIQKIADCDAFMWHWCQADYRSLLFAKQLLFAVQLSGIKTFPDFNTVWHYDDKVAQKYLFESQNIPLVPSYVFYTKKEALDWIKGTSFPKVFKLRGGAGASNVWLCRDAHHAKRLAKKAFTSGFTQFDRKGYLKERFHKFLHGRDTIVGVMKGIARLFIPTTLAKMYHREKGYMYFQDFIPNNTYDIRVCIVQNKAFAIKRLCREGDFRASGSGRLIYDKDQIDERCIEVAFEANRAIKAQSIAFDFVFDENDRPLIVEISYAYSVGAYDSCEGYWDENLKWHQGNNFDFCGWMVESVLNS